MMMKLKNPLLAVLLLGGCATVPEQREKPGPSTESPSVESRLQQAAQSPQCHAWKARWSEQLHTDDSRTLVGRTLALFEEMLAAAPSLYEPSAHSSSPAPALAEARSYEQLSRQAQKQRYELFDAYRKGSAPDVVLLGWIHAPLVGPDSMALTPEMGRGLAFIFDSYQAQDIILPEGIESGGIWQDNFYTPFGDINHFLLQEFQEAIRKGTAREIRRKMISSPVFFAGADHDLSLVLEHYKKHLELWEMLERLIKKKAENNRQEGLPLLNEYLRRSELYFPELSHEEHMNFPARFYCLHHFMSCNYNGRRELEYLVPTIKGLTARKKPEQMLYVPWGAYHIANGKVTAALREAEISFMAFLPSGYKPSGAIACDDGNIGNKRKHD